MSEKYIQRVKDEEYYKNLIEEQKKALKIINKRVREQEKELFKLRHENKVTLNLLSKIKESLTTQRWKYLTPIEIEGKMKRFKTRIEKLEEE